MKTVIAAGTVALLLTLPATSLADGDPASDYLPTFNVYLPYSQPIAQSSKAPLENAVETVYAKHYRIKIAVIATAADLGAIPTLFGRPTEYARFLGQELMNFYVGPLLIVMPAGFGIYDGGRSTTAEQRVLARSPTTGTTIDELTAAARKAVRALLAAHALVSRDIVPPLIEPASNTIRPGRTINLHYTALDDSGYAAVQLQVRQDTRVIARFQIPLRRVDPSKISSVKWHVPAQVRGPLTLCLSGIDGSGNRSRRICSPLQLS